MLAPLPALALLPVLWAASLAPNSAGVETDFTSRYTWRGMAYSSGAAVQPYGWLTAGDFTVSLWGNADLDRERQSGSAFNGGDVMVGWSRNFGRWRLEPAFEFWFDRPVEEYSIPPRVNCRFVRHTNSGRCASSSRRPSIRFDSAARITVKPGRTLRRSEKVSTLMPACVRPGHRKSSIASIRELRSVDPRSRERMDPSLIVFVRESICVHTRKSPG